MCSIQFSEDFSNIPLTHILSYIIFHMQCAGRQVEYEGTLLRNLREPSSVFYPTLYPICNS